MQPKCQHSACSRILVRLGIRAVQERCPPVFATTQVSTFGMLKDSSASRNTSRSRALPTGVRNNPSVNIRHAQGFSTAPKSARRSTARTSIRACRFPVRTGTSPARREAPTRRTNHRIAKVRGRFGPESFPVPSVPCSIPFMPQASESPPAAELYGKRRFARAGLGVQVPSRARLSTDAAPCPSDGDVVETVILEDCRVV